MGQVMVLIRGLPGSGKSTLAEKFVNEINTRVGEIAAHAVETDQFFVSSNGHKEIYRFDRRLIGAAHDECYGRAMRHLYNGNSVIVANTFTTRREIERYTTGLERSGLQDVQVIIVKAVGNFRSIHNVPANARKRMAARWEDFSGEVIYNG